MNLVETHHVSIVNLVEAHRVSVVVTNGGGGQLGGGGCAPNPLASFKLCKACLNSYESCEHGGCTRGGGVACFKPKKLAETHRKTKKTNQKQH